MKFTETQIHDLYVIETEPINDNRGYFMRIFGQDDFKKAGLKFSAVQVNRSLTLRAGTIRGIHFQKQPKTEDKIIKCLKGSVYDVAVDLRKNSSTYGQWVAEELNEDNRKMLFIPKGFAHGFQTLSDNCEMLYLLSEFYSPEHASGVRWNDPVLNIEWPLELACISEQDKMLPLVSDIDKSALNL